MASGRLKGQLKAGCERSQCPTKTFGATGGPKGWQRSDKVRLSLSEHDSLETARGCEGCENRREAPEQRCLWLGLRHEFGGWRTERRVGLTDIAEES